MAKDYNRAIKVGYDVKIIGAETINVEQYNSQGYITRCFGTTKPTDGGAGFAKGCLFVDTDVATGTSGLYENIGTTAACNFNVIGAISAGEIALATGSILIGAAGVGSALDVKTSGQILVGNGTTGVSVAVSGDATLASSGALTIASGAVTRTKMSAAAASKAHNFTTATIDTTGNTDYYILAPETGTLSSVDFNGVDALSASDSNYITWSMVNLGQSGGGTTDMLDTGAVNTTKVTGGAALSANTKRALSIHGTAGNLAVVQGDLIRIRAAATGTLGNTVTIPRYCVRFTGTT